MVDDLPLLPMIVDDSKQLSLCSPLLVEVRAWSSLNIDPELIRASTQRKHAPGILMAHSVYGIWGHVPGRSLWDLEKVPYKYYCLPQIQAYGLWKCPMFPNFETPNWSGGKKIKNIKIIRLESAALLMSAGLEWTHTRFPLDEAE